MMKPQTQKKSNQHQEFVEKARELGCDEDEAAFEDKIRRIATADRIVESGRGGECGAKDRDR